MRRLGHAYGTRIEWVLCDARSLDALGPHYGAGLYEREIDYLGREEWARTADDLLWRRTKLGLHMTAEEIAAVERRTMRAAEASA